jgi:cell division protein FtsI (penicillin-binding protein 3)
MPLAELNKRKLADEDKTFVWLKRQVDEPVARQIAALGLKGIYQRKEYKRQYPEGEAAAHVVGFTNVEDKGQEGVELAFDKDLAGRAGSRRVIKDRLGRVVEDVGEQIPPVDGRDLQLSPRQQGAVLRLPEAARRGDQHKAKAGSVVVLDAVTGEVLALANYPSYVPDKRRNLTGEQLRNRALTDTFEPGSTMKPITVAMALEAGRVSPADVIETAPGAPDHRLHHQRHAQLRPLTVEGVIQKSSNVGTLKIAQKMQPQEMWETYTRLGYGQKPQMQFPARFRAGCAPGRPGARSSRPPCPTATACRPALFQMARSYTGVRPRRRGDPGHAAQERPPAAGQRVFSPETARAVRKMLQMAAAPAAPAPWRRPWATRWAASPARRTSRSARATPPTSTAPGSPAWRRSTSRASSWR